MSCKFTFFTEKLTQESLKKPTSCEHVHACARFVCPKFQISMPQRPQFSVFLLAVKTNTRKCVILIGQMREKRIQSTFSIGQHE